MSTKNIPHTKIRSDFLRKNYTRITISVTNKELEEASESFISFLSLPEVVKRDFSVVADKNDRGSESGYVKRSAQSGYDNKEYFNYRGITEVLLKKAYKKYNKIPEINDFTEKAKRVYSKVVEDFEKIVTELEKAYPGISKKVHTNKKKGMCLRFIRYVPTSDVSKNFAKPHYDRGFATVTIYENAPGLMVGRNDASLAKVLRREGSGVLMPSFTFPRDVNDPTMLPAWHVVRSTSKTKSEGRLAIVFFIDTYSDNTITYEDTHTSIRG